MVFFQYKVRTYVMVFVLLVLGSQNILVQSILVSRVFAQDVVLNGAACAVSEHSQSVCKVMPHQCAEDLSPRALLKEKLEEKRSLPVLKTLQSMEQFRVKNETFRKHVEEARFAATQERVLFENSVKDKVYVGAMRGYRVGLKQYKTYFTHYKKSLKVFFRQHPSLKPIQPHSAIKLVVRRKKVINVVEDRAFPHFPDS